MLGPLEAVSGGEPIALGGSKQRATLGFLLLQPNQVVPASQLLRALWSVEEAPATARKILQNAVWGLRRALAAEDGADCPVSLRTQAPGYSLRVDPERVDLHLFHQWVEEGRTQLAAGAPEEASLLLRDALALWRGPLLADLVEVGVLWPELTTVQNARLDVLEDYFEAQLACGRQYAVLGELEAMVEAEPLRERSCGQLMRTLYRCGRQADALGVYSRLRSSLVEDLGLEPSRELQMLQTAILAHDPVLQMPDAAAPAASPAARRQELRLAPAPAPRPRQVVSERQRVSVLLVRTELGPEFDGVDGAEVDSALEGAATGSREQIERHGGVVAASMGSVCLGLFPASGGADHAERAVGAAAAIRDALAFPLGTDVRAAVATGEALVRHQPGDDSVPPSVQGALLHECQAFLTLVVMGEIQVCDATRRATGDRFSYARLPGAPARWQLLGSTPDQPGSAGAPHREAGGHASELDLLRGLLGHTRSRGTAHLVTVLGGSDAARAGLLMEFQRGVAGRTPQPAQFLFWRQPPAVEHGRFAVHRMILASYCGLLDGDSSRTIRDKLHETVHRLADDEGRTNWLVSRLIPLVDPAIGTLPGPADGELADAWHQFLERAARDRPLVVIFDDLHRAGDALLELVEPLAESSGSVPLLVVAGAGAELLHRRPHWAGGRRHATTLTLDPAAPGLASVKPPRRAAAG
ncbi:BTAD domain-containing putative transcriptional regulator [Streptomyces sp. NPDC058646]|uniref:BTAD domain-containing putative transcriptional regulator n=1 Tax=Streptomyces sp. NPDC058646 TaxID=3346574 RepID=UPI003652C81B